MAQRHQRGWLKKEKRAQGETWVLFFRTTRKSDGKRVENKIAIGLLRDLPDASSAWAEVERLHIPINQVDVRRGLTFGDLAQHYAEHELVECSESIRPKAHTRPSAAFLKNSSVDKVRDSIVEFNSRFRQSLKRRSGKKIRTGSKGL